MKNPIHTLQLKQAKFVAGLTDDQLAWIARGAPRWLIVRAIPIVLPLKFRKSVGGDIDGVLELRFVDPDGGPPDRIQLSMRGGRCRGSRNGTSRPDATATMHVTDLIRLAVASVDAGWLMHDRRVTLTGDVFLFVRFPSAFGLHTRPLYAKPRGLALRP